MVKVIMGVPGTGKTKQLIDLVNVAINKESGNVVCIEKGEKLRFEIKYNARLVDITSHNLEQSADSLYAFICGLYAGNYDITHIFIDNLYKVANAKCPNCIEGLLAKLDKFSEETGVKFTVTISADINEATEGIKKFF